MKLIIDIPEEDYIRLRDEGMFGNVTTFKRAVREGIPLEQEPCEDAISRQAVLDVTWEEPSYTDALNVLTEVRDKVKVLPSVTPTEKVGRWITQWNAAHQKEYYYCSECREEFSYDGETGIKMNDYRYCPNCGAKMQEVEE